MSSLVMILLAILTATAAANPALKVIDVHDGDTITVSASNAIVKVRLLGIDCPELFTPCADEATEFVQARCLGSNVTLRIFGSDKFGRTLAEVILPDGNSLNRLLLANGLARWYSEHNGDESMAALEKKARDAKLGIWAEKEKATSQNADDPTVYVTRTGTKYHKAGCRYLTSSASPLPLSEAMQTYGACSVCFGVAPATESAVESGDRPTGETTKTGKTIYEGPRGGHYHYSKNGKKVYEKK